MKKLLFKFFLGSWVLTLISCSVTTYKYINIQVLSPSDTMLPSNTTKLHILDNCSLQKNDSTFGNLCVKGKNQSLFDTTLVWILEESPSFKYIPIVIQTENELKSEMKNNPEKGHVVLTSEYRVKIDTSDFVYNPYSYYGNYVVTLKLKVDLSDARTLKPYDSYKFYDSLSWPRQNAQGKKNPTKITDLFAYAENMAAEKYADHIGSYWNTEKRMYYYNSGSLMQLGYNHFNENDLEGALTYWKNAFEKGNVTTKALAAYDIGLVYEMLDDLDECERWLLKSKELKKYPPVYNYLNIIKKRKTDHLKLDKMLRN